MAKQPSKKPKPAKAKKRSATLLEKIQQVETALELLENIDASSALALSELGAVLGVSPPTIRFKMCVFELYGVLFVARVTELQRAAILNAVEQNGNVFATVSGLIGSLNPAVAAAFTDLSAPFDPPPARGPVILVPVPPPLGCCTCDSGQVANLTAAQCSQFAPSTWTQPPNCMEVKP